MKNRSILKRIYVCLFYVFSVSLLASKANAALINNAGNKLTLYIDGWDYIISHNEDVIGILDRRSVLEIFKNLDFFNLTYDFKKSLPQNLKQLLNVRKAHIDLYWLSALAILATPQNYDNELLTHVIVPILFFSLKSSQVFQKLRKVQSNKINILLNSILAGITPPYPISFLKELLIDRPSQLDALRAPEDILVDTKLFAEYIRRIEEYRDRTLIRDLGYGYRSYDHLTYTDQLTDE